MPGPSRLLTSTSARDLIDRECLTPAGRHRVGLELEFLVYAVGDRCAPPTTALLDAVEQAALPGGSRVTFEPGGQVELSGPPQEDVGAACTAMASDIAVVRETLAAHGAELVAAGVDPLRPPRRVIHGPRYDAMEAFFDADGPAGRTMMCSTASIQVNLDLGDAADAAGRWRQAHAVAPVLAAAFANSPASNGTRSARLANWWAIDPTRTAPCDAKAWADYALDARVMLIRVDEHRYVPLTESLTFADWIARGHPLGSPDADDLRYHLTTLFPPVRARGWLEVRVIDALPDPWWRVAVAVATALLDDPVAAEAALRATVRTAGLWHEAARRGLGHPLLAAAARTCFAAALDAFPRLGVDPTTADAAGAFVERFVARGRCPADDLLRVPCN